MKAVLMAGGEGSRLRPLTSNRPKPLVPVANIPAIEHVIKLLKEYDITDIVVTLHYLADEIITYLGDGSAYGVQLIYSIEDEPLGTAGSVKKMEKYFDDVFIIISADALTNINLEEILKFHKEKKGIATIALKKVPNPIEFGVVITSEDGKIQKFLEKPNWGEVFSDTVNTGIYVLEPSVFNYMEKNKFYDFSADLFPAVLNDNKDIYGYITDAYWCDIGNIQQYVKANEDIMEDGIKAEILGKKIQEKVWMGEGTKIHPSAQIKGRVIIGKGCKIGKDVFIGNNTIIGDNCIIEEDVHLDRVILWNNVYISKSCRLNQCIIGQYNTIKPHVNIGEGAIIGDKCFIGQNSIISPQVKIWPQKYIEAGALVNMSIIWGARWPSSLFSSNGVQGLANIELTPEFALRLGSAFGAYLEKGSTVVTARDEHPASRMLNRAIICGLISVGINVYDLRVMPSPVSHYIINSTEIRGGVHVKISSDDPQSFIIQFFDEAGINIDRQKERKIENLFFREDFRLTSVDEVGAIDFPARVAEQYTQTYINMLDSKAIAAKKFKVVIDYSYGNSTIILPLILGKLGCETIALNSYLDVEKGRQVQVERDKYLEQLSNIVKTLNADFGVFLNWDSEKIVLVDNEGGIIQNELLLVLLSKLIIENTNPQVIAVPITSSSIIDTIAKGKNCAVIRTKTDDRSLMYVSNAGKDKIAFAGNSLGSFIFPQFNPSFDALFSFAKILEIMSKFNIKLSEIRKSIPEFYISYRSISCTAQFKGRVMRQLIELNRNKDIELMEGIKIFFDKGWINIIPDPIQPYLHIYAESGTQQEAEKYIDEYADKIQRLKGEESIMVSRIRERSLPAFVPEVKIPGDIKDKAYAFSLSKERAFYFWLPTGYIGVKARNVDEFLNILNYVDANSIEYHLYQGDFERWFQNELNLKDISILMGKIKSKNLHGEDLREEILRIFYAFKEEIIK